MYYKSLFVLGSLRKEGMSQEEVDHLFNAIVLPNFFLRFAGLWCLRFRPFCNTEFFRPVYEKKVYVQECKYQGLAREGGQDTLQKRSNDSEFRSSSFYLRKRTRGTILEIRQSLSLESTLTGLRTFLVTE